MTLLEKDPANRFPSANSVVQALDTGRMPHIERAPSAYPADNLPVEPPRRPTPYAAARTEDLYPAGPTPEEWRRWEEPLVVRFRRKLAPYLFVNGVIVVASIVGSTDFFGVTVLWSIYLAFRYAKLWSDGYDWRDVFRQPRDRDLIDVADDFLTYVRALKNPEQRKVMREQRRMRLSVRRTNNAGLPRMQGGQVLSSGRSGDDVVNVAGPYGDRIRRAESDRDEILRLLDRMPSAERARKK
jgi:hypothetical protein